MIKIALLGYGRMGKAIEKIALDRGHQIVCKIDKDTPAIGLELAEVAINFSVPDAAVNNIKTAFDLGVPVVCGTTGWLAHKKDIENLAIKKNTAFLYASNFSLGVNIFFHLNRKLAQLMNGQNQYEIKMEEIHHTQKLDAPSGTAITLAEGVIENSNYERWELKKSDLKSIPITAIREDEVPGTHKVSYASSEDQIDIIHTAHNRQGFALGAVIAAEWLAGKKGVFSMDDVLNIS